MPQRLPPQIAIPFLAVSKHHDLPPTATYSSLVLWNFAFQSPYCDLTDPGNLRSLLTVTGTKDEEWFYLISVALESRGGPIITTLLSCMDAVRHRDDAAVIASLAQTTLSIQKIDALLQRMHEHCDPQVYYHDMRPLLAGTKGMAASGLPKGVFFDEGEGRGEWHQYSGGSNGQSSLIQFLDIALGVDHYATGAPRGRSADDGVKSKANGYIQVRTSSIKPPFLPLKSTPLPMSCPPPANIATLPQEMRRYMPGPHRSFLSYIDKTTNIRAYAHAPDTHAAVRTAYNDTLAALARFRDGHINIVTRYVITPSKAPPASYVKRTTGLNLASATSCGVREAMKAAAAAGKGEGEGESEGAAKQKRAKEDGLEMYGTGGTDLIPFLKQTRDETREAALPR